LNTVFLEWMERLQKCVQVDSEYVGWAKRTEYIEIDFNREIRLCYTWRGTPYRCGIWETDLSSDESFCSGLIWIRTVGKVLKCSDHLRSCRVIWNR
jgi:hypothetical protein